ncbi:hypothetical protein Pcinc_011509 [Petrolisthes cinctipes]|uniref:Uncharacterized protein n=1 Tax=Petrolisthes cinctipes TaxID=88211 RepID=A0AAE1G0R5_PETCI|nr:hypothetical protein Pcinc_011509 [Petrolisthes cinctipes]
MIGVEGQPRRGSLLSNNSTDDSACHSEDDPLLPANAGEDDPDVPPLSLSPPASPPLLNASGPSLYVDTLHSSSTPSPARFLASNQYLPHYYSLKVQAEDEVELTPHAEQPVLEEQEGETEEEEEEEEEREHSSQLLRFTYRMEREVPGEERRWWGTRSGAIGSLPSLTEPDSPRTASLDLEWEPEAALAAVHRERREKDTGAEGAAASGTEEEAVSHSQTMESGNSWMPRSSSCSTPNSLEWDFRASTLSLRGEDDMAWRHTDMETEQLLYEIEQLAARALADTGHVLNKTGSSVEDFKQTPPR